MSRYYLLFFSELFNGDMVIMSMEIYERKMALLEVYKKLSEAEKELADGMPLKDGEKVFKELREKYGK